MPSQRLLPSNGVNTDLGEAYMPSNMARFIKNLSYVLTDTSESDPSSKGGTGYFKPLERNQIYDAEFILPGLPIDNHNAGSYCSKEENCVLFLNYNKNGDHGLYLILGDSDTVQTVYQKSCLNLQLKPEHFLHEGGGWLEVFNFIDPNIGLNRKRSYFMFTDGYNPMRFICIEDSIATNGFDSSLFPYFINPHPECLLINAGVPTPSDCITITEVPNDNPAATNNLRFNTWQFRVMAIDVYGRVSEHGKISDIYIPGTNDCIGASELLARCLDITFDAGNALIDKFQIEYRNCNDEQWFVDTTLFLYKGSNLGDWWLRERNESVSYNPDTHQITYRFCRDKECNPIPIEETNRTQNPLPKITQSVAKVGKAVSVWDNNHGFNPFGNDIMDEISVTVTPPNPSDSPIRNIEIFVPIYNPFTQTYQPVYKNDDDIWVFGGRRSFTNSYTINVATDYKQFFGDTERKGFIGYLAGTGSPPQAAVSELYYVNETTNEFVKVEDFSIVFQPAIDGPIINDYRRRWYLKFTFNSIAPAKYLFRISASTASLTDAYQNTSTYVGGQFPWTGKHTDFESKISPTPELIIDVCEGDYNSLNDIKVLVIYDLTSAEVGSNTHPASGYIYEKIENDILSIPVELLRVQKVNFPIFTEVKSEYTDHNGFYFIGTKNADYEIGFYGDYNCTNQELIEINVGDQDRLYEQNRAISEEEDFSDYPDLPCNRVLITATVKECGTNVPVPGVGVVLSRGQSGVTGADGTITIIAHDFSESGTSQRIDELIYAPTICAFKGCDTTCVEPYQVIINHCSSCVSRIIIADEKQVLFEIKRGLLSGGKYGICLWGNDWLGRHQFAQTKDSMYINIPTIVDTMSFAPSKVTLNIPPTVTFPSEIDYLSIGVTKELIMGGVYIDWIVDRVEFIDNSGNENDIAPTQIKIYYASLIEYNKQNNFNTTTQWQFVVQSSPSQINYTSDYVEFYVNGDGQFFPSLVRALVKYDQTGQYFLIEYDTALKELSSGALMRLCRPQQCATQDLFFELCVKIPVINGKAQQINIDLNAFDTYYKYRQIPIPIPTDDPTVTENVIRTFGFPFEHHSPSDFWGDHCQNIGRQNVRNPYEAEILRNTQAMLSGALSVNGQLNYLNYFDEALATDFNSWNFGKVVSVIPFTGGVLVICEFSTFTVGFDDNMVRQNSDGTLSVPSGSNLFGRPDSSTISVFGCSLFDKNTIRKKEGLVQFLDTRECVLIQHDFSQPKPVSRNVVDSYFQAKVKFVIRWNTSNEDKRYFVGTINPGAKEYLLTDFLIGSNQFVNKHREISISSNDTVIFDYFNKTDQGGYLWRGWYSFTAENYAYLESQSQDLQLFSFKNGIPYKHYTQDSDKIYSNFFGEDVEMIIAPVLVIDAFEKKKLTNAQVYCKTLYWSDKLTTDSNQRTRMLKSAWKQGDFFWSAGIRCDLNTPYDPNRPLQTGDNKLMDGNNLYGSTSTARFVCVPPESNVYSELLGFIIDTFSYEKSGGDNSNP